MFRFIQSRMYLQVIALVAVLVWAVFQVVTSTQCLQLPATALYWDSFAPLQEHYVSLCLILALGSIFQIVLTDVYYFRGGFGDTHHLMVILWYLILLCCGGFVAQISPIWFTNILLVLVVSINFDYDSGNLKSKDLLSGILTGIATLFYPPAVMIGLFVVNSLIINRFSKYKDILIVLFGIFLVYLYVFCYYLFTDRLVEFYKTILCIQWGDTFSSTVVFSWREIVLLATAATSILYAFTVLKIEYDNKQIILRKRLLTIHLIMISCILMMVFSPFDVHYSIVVLLFPMTLYYAMLSQIKRHSLINDIMMLIFVAALCL